jgi:cobalt/nickel transport system ATP-binding protein
MTPIVELKQICFTYPGAEKPVLDHLDLTLNPGDRIGLMAPNGSGKTTLLHTIMGLCRPQSGSIRLFGAPMREEKQFSPVRPRLGLLFQDSDDQLFCPTVLDDVAFGPLNLGASRQGARQTARQVLERLGIAGFENRVTHRLSGGQKRLVALAAVLAMSPEMLLLDEPTSGLDTQVKQTLSDILTGLDISYFIISHEFDFIDTVTDRIFSMEKGRILSDEQIHVHAHEHVHKHGQHPHHHK